MPGSVTAPASIMSRLPVGQQAAALQRLSRNANAPGAAVKRSGRSVRRDFAKRCGELGIILIESDVTGALAANVGTVNPPGVALVTIDTNAGTPATTDIDASELDAVTWAGAGVKTLAVTVPANAMGQAKVSV